MKKFPKSPNTHAQCGFGNGVESIQTSCKMTFFNNQKILVILFGVVVYIYRQMGRGQFIKYNILPRKNFNKPTILKNKNLSLYFVQRTTIPGRQCGGCWRASWRSTWEGNLQNINRLFLFLFLLTFFKLLEIRVNVSEK